MSDIPIIPVVDVLNGVAVQAIAGRRDEYQPVRSRLTPSIDPSVILNEMVAACGADRAYVADLDAILRREPNRCTIAELTRMDVRLMLDAGVKSSGDVQDLLDLGVDDVVLGLESLPGPVVAQQLVRQFGSEHLIVSLDLQGGCPMTSHQPWCDLDPRQIAAELSAAGFHRWIVLDLTTVGTGCGVPTIDLCRDLRQQWPDIELITGGGIHTHDDLLPLQGIADAVLLATAIHTGRIR